MARAPAAVTIAAVAALALTLAGVAIAHEGPVYTYPVATDDVTIKANLRSAVCEADGSQRIEIRRKLTINTPRGAELFAPPSVSWREGTATAWLLDVTVRREGLSVFHLGPRSGGPELELYATDDGIGPMRSAELPLPELQAGDLVEWAVELRRKALIPGQIFAQMNWSLEHPVERGHFSIEMPRATALKTRSWGPVGEPLVVPDGDRVTWTWRVDETIRPLAVTADDVLPQTIVSSARSWAVVGRWYRKQLMAAGGELGDARGAELVASVAGLDHEQRTEAIFSQVRTGLALPHARPWSDAFTARVPADVLESGIGDCKDRAWLIYRACQEAGLTPHLAVTGLAHGAPALAEQPPTPLLLNHVLVGVSGPGRMIWMDPTGAAEQEVDCGRTLQALVLDARRLPVVTIDRLERPVG